MEEACLHLDDGDEGGGYITPQQSKLAKSGDSGSHMSYPCLLRTDAVRKDSHSHNSSINIKFAYPTPTTATFGSFQQHPHDNHVSTIVTPVSATFSDNFRVPRTGPADEKQSYSLTGLFQHEDVVLKGLLNHSRRGSAGHCCRDTADLWMYILQLFFQQGDGFYLNVHGDQQDDPGPKEVDGHGKGGDDTDDDGDYDEDETDGSMDEEQDSEDENDLVDFGAEMPVCITAWKQTSHPDHAQGGVNLAPAIPIFTVLCASEKARFVEYPTMRHKGANSNAIHAPTSTFLLSKLQQRLSSLVQAYNTNVFEMRANGIQDSPDFLKNMTGAVACGTSVVFYTCKASDTQTGWVTPQSAHDLDMVNGSPSHALKSVERILTRVAISGKNK